MDVTEDGINYIYFIVLPEMERLSSSTQNAQAMSFDPHC